MKKAKNILLWALTVFMLLAALVYMPSAASVLMLLFAAVAIPIPKVQEFWRSKRIAGPLKAAALCVLFVVSVSMAPVDRTKTEDDEKDTGDPVKTEAPSADKEAGSRSPVSGPSESEEFVQEVKTAIEGQVGDGEEITDVQLDGDGLVVFVDISGASIPSGISIGLDDLAKSRFSSITDKILELDRYDDIWETITVDFGDVGRITCGKRDIEESDYGRYFSSGAVNIQSPQPLSSPISSEDGATYPDIAELFASVVPGAEIAVTCRSETALHIKLITQMPSDAAPERWADILSAMAEALTAAEGKKADHGASALSAEMIAEDGSILASGFDGKIQFNKFEERDIEINEIESSIDPEEIDKNANSILSNSNVTVHPSVSTASSGSGNGANFDTYDNEEQQNTASSYVLNTSTMKFHYPSCNSVPKIAPDNYATSSASRSTLISQGYDPCGKCNP